MFGILEGFISNLQKQFLLALNQRQEWLKCNIDKVNILAKKIFKHLLDGKVAELLPKQEEKAKNFDYWLKFSTLRKDIPYTFH